MSSSSGSSHGLPNDKVIELLRKNKDSLAIDWKKLSSNPNNSNNPNNKAIMINIKSKRSQNEDYMKQFNYNYNQHEILNIIYNIHRRRVLTHIRKFMIWMI
jgi:hypothetical protein